MKKIVFLILVFGSSLIATAQTNDACASLLKIAGLVNSKQLKTLEGKVFESKYYKTLFGDSSKTNQRL